MIIIKDISCLVTCAGEGKKSGGEMNDAGIIKNGYIVIKNNRIADVGMGGGYLKWKDNNPIVISGKGKTVTPGLVDPHTHLVYGGSREGELLLKLNNVSYIDILKSGGGILSTVESTRRASIEELVEVSMGRLNKMLQYGTTTVESKSGYGLSTEEELKLLKVNQILNNKSEVDVVSTFMGAHAVPNEYLNNREGYIDLIINDMIPRVKEGGYAEFIDCFCEKGVFSVEETRRILYAGRTNGLRLKLHGDEVEAIGGAELAGNMKCISAEHLIAASDEGIKSLAKNGVIAVLLPATAFYLMKGRYARARYMIDNGVSVALATDCNPGTCPTESMQTVMSFACFGMGMKPEEIINAMTINAAAAIGRECEIGSIEVGKKADIAIFNAKNLNYLIYHFGINAVEKVIKNGNIVISNV